MPLRRFGTSGRGFRIMVSKRTLASIFVTVCFCFGMYLAFFNHPPAAETLEINLHRGIEEGDNSKKVAPHFRHLHFRGDTAKSSSVRALNLSDTSNETLKKKETVTISKEAKNKTVQNTFDFDDAVHRTGDEEGDPVHQEHTLTIEHREMHSGQNAKEYKLTEDSVEDTNDDENKSRRINLDKNVGKSKEYGPHHIRIFDWDNWVKQNKYIDIGTIWAFCGKCA